MLNGKKPLNVAMIGCGGYAGLLIDLIFEIPESCRLIAATTRRPESDDAQKLIARGITVCRDVDELLETVTPEECPAIIIPTSIDSHREYTEKVIERGFHVMLEKPPAATVQDVDWLIDLQRRSGKWIAVNFQHLFNPMTQQLKARLSSGEFGAILSVKATALWPRSEAYFARSSWSGKMMVDGQWVLDGTIGNPFAHLLAEALYLATPFAGMAVPASMQAELYHINDIESEDTSCLRMETAEGVPLFFCTSLCSETVEPVCCEIETEKALIRLEDFSRVSNHWKDGRIETETLDDDDPQLDRKSMLRVLAAALSENRRPVITVEECRPYVLAWNGAFESSGIPAAAAESVFECVDSAEAGWMRTIPDARELLRKAVEQNRLFSELDSAWSGVSEPVDLRSYQKFPSLNPELISLVPEAGQPVLEERLR